MSIEIEVLDTWGRSVAAAGLGLSFDKPIVDDADFERRALRILDKGSPSEAKFLRQMFAAFKVRAPRYWWQEFATYRVGVEVQSASTMHTILRHELGPDDFADGDVGIDVLLRLNELRAAKDWYRLKKALPEGFLQTRVVTASYQALRGVYRDRRSHRLPEWVEFCDVLRSDALPAAYLITYSVT